ncbi:hypothetical protein [Bifidobacterium eulemuris]|uniref:Uncharacterized protein n=1 Tax=Bifidobacterium eulemuris TaxID=1765219 RepID=A0A261GCZ6_9BIFI|nr:hypothetical protein [Bifidobacterium eulemuris]OZG69311.1 hypothetical protein BEUL_0717 [Bifidobacterium eulemuris]QOL31189.1 hypothetical protein BE0216_00980 [Bifidobacterium eulemuris]
MARDVSIRVVIDGREISREDVQKKEMERCIHASRKLNLKIQNEELSEIRQLILQRKLDLGQDVLKKLMRKETCLADILVRRFVRLSHEEYVLSGIDIYANGISAKDFTAWFDLQVKKNNIPAMLAAHPEHYIIDNRPDGTQYVCETNGGSPFAAAFTIYFNETNCINIPLLADHPHRIEGVSKLSDGKRVGAARHQFQDTPEGLQGHLCIEFPKKTMAKVVDGHKWHLAIEFSNWLEAAAADIGS